MKESPTTPKVLEIIPIMKGLPLPSLSYFSTENIPLGSLVKVPVQSKIVTGIVSKVSDAKNMKTDIKGAPFVLKKLIQFEAEASINPAFIKAAQKTARFYASTL